jgi:hypothetical protein
MNENEEQIMEAAELLGLDFTKLTAGGRLRCELVAALRAVVDDALTKVTRGSATDLAKLVTATEALTGLLKESPAATAQEPVLDPRDDPHARLMAVIDNWLANHETEKAERAAERAAQGLPPLPVDLETAQREIEQLREENQALKFWADDTKALAAPDGARAIDVPTSAITPPGEIGECYAGKRYTADDMKAMRPKATIDAKAESVELMPDGSRCPPGGRWCPVRNRVVPIPPTALSGDETRRRQDAVNARRDIDHAIMTAPSAVSGEPAPSTPMTTYGDSNFFFEGDKGRAW